LPWPEPVVIGPELVTNGTFDTDTDWTLAAGATISGGILSFAAGASTQATQEVTIDSSKVYKVTIDVVRRGGGLSLRLTGGTTKNFESAITATGSYTYYVVPNVGNDILSLVGTNSSNDFDIDNISVKEINPLAVSIQMEGTMTYADTGSASEKTLMRWYSEFNRNITWWLRTDGADTGEIQFFQRDPISGADTVLTSNNPYAPDINVPFNIASRHGSTFINGAVDGTALTANTTPTALPDLSATNFQLGHDYMGTIGKLRVWADDIGDTGIAEAST